MATLRPLLRLTSRHTRPPALRSSSQAQLRPFSCTPYSLSESPKSESQLRTPWIRQGSDLPPAKRRRNASAMTKGKLLTTPSRMLKLILPLTTTDRDTDRKDIEPLALLLHPSQPLSYLERLIQAELPTYEDEKGRERIPSIEFHAEDSKKHQDSIERSPKKTYAPKKDGKSDLEVKQDGKEADKSMDETGEPRDGAVERYSGESHEAPDSSESTTHHFVRWSKSTEIGDFIQDAARGKEFLVDIEGRNAVRVGVPSFNDRTHYMRQRLRNSMRQIKNLVQVKDECDKIAHKHAQRIAYTGAGLLIGWWYLVYRLTFETSLGWDVMEPVTYLVGLSGIIASYLFFLYKNREVSYSSAMKLTVSSRRQKLYQAEGFDVIEWENLCEEANVLKKEIKAIAREYDTDWSPETDGQDEQIKQVLKQEDKKHEKSKKDDDDDDDGSESKGAKRKI